MLRFAFGIFVAVAFFVTPARAEGELAAKDAIARIIIEALAPTTYGDTAYRWDAVSIRVSRHLHWHIYAPDPRKRGDVRRNGWIDAADHDVGVSVVGGEESVRSLSFTLPTGLTTLEMLDSIRAAGAEASFQSDFETYTEYWSAPPGRDGATLSNHRICTSPHGAAMQRCHDELVLTFEQRQAAD